MVTRSRTRRVLRWPRDVAGSTPPAASDMGDHRSACRPRAVGPRACRASRGSGRGVPIRPAAGSAEISLTSPRLAAAFVGRACRDHARSPSSGELVETGPASGRTTVVTRSDAVPDVPMSPPVVVRRGVGAVESVVRGVGAGVRRVRGAGRGSRRGCRGGRAGTGTRAGWSTHRSRVPGRCRSSRRGSWPGDAGGTTGRRCRSSCAGPSRRGPGGRSRRRARRVPGRGRVWCTRGTRRWGGSGWSVPAAGRGSRRPRRRCARSGRSRVAR